MEFCPECHIGLSNAQIAVGYCNNCHCDFEEYLSKEKKEWDGVCRCGHKHSEHGKSSSINYTAGRCGVSGCNCKHFLMPNPQPQAAPKADDDEEPFSNEEEWKRIGEKLTKKLPPEDQPKAAAPKADDVKEYVEKIYPTKGDLSDPDRKLHDWALNKIYQAKFLEGFAYANQFKSTKNDTHRRRNKGY